jgi:hypothetical protein
MHRRLTPLAGSIIRRLPLLLLVLLVGATAIGARCIERTSSHVDADGYTHVTGQMVNDTETQATGMMLQATLYDAANNIVATKTGPTCPPDSQPHQQTVFDLRFDNPNLPPWDHFAVAPVAGKAQPDLLPDPKMVLFFAEAVRFTSPIVLPGLTISDKDVYFEFEVRNQTNNTYNGVQGCSAVYDQAGNVVFVDQREITQQTGPNAIGPVTVLPQQHARVFMVAKDVPAGPVQVRAWLWLGPKGAPTSQYQFMSTQMMTIQSLHP